jgi:hypothetical protein
MIAEAQERFQVHIALVHISNLLYRSPIKPSCGASPSRFRPKTSV